MEAECVNPYLALSFFHWALLAPTVLAVLAVLPRQVCRVRHVRQVRLVHRLTLVAPRVQAAQEDPEDLGDLWRPDLDQWASEFLPGLVPER